MLRALEAEIDAAAGAVRDTCFVIQIWVWLYFVFFFASVLLTRLCLSAGFFLLLDVCRRKRGSVAIY